MSPFKILQSLVFQKDFINFDEVTKKKINDIIMNEIANNPENFDLMRYEYEGIREVRIGRYLRLLFAICDECRDLRAELKKCDDCNQISHRSIKLLTCFFHRGKYPKLNRIIR